MRATEEPIRLKYRRLPLHNMIRSTTGSASMPLQRTERRDGLKCVLGSFFASLLASILALCWRAGNQVENSE